MRFLAAIGLTAIVSGCGGSPSPQAQLRADRGAEDYWNHCAACHGPEGKGDGPVAAFLTEAPTDLTRIAARNDGDFPEQRVRWSIDGRLDVLAHGSRGMPVWGPAFRHQVEAGPIPPANREDAPREDRIGDLVDYLKQLQAPAD